MARPRSFRIPPPRRIPASRGASPAIMNNIIIPRSGETAFVSTWDTENLGGTGSATKVVNLPWTNPGQDVDWGDGTVNQLDVHTYATGVGIKTITIAEAVTGFRFVGGGDKLKIISIISTGGLVFDNSLMFFNCSNLESVSGNNPSVTTTDLFACFDGASSMTEFLVTGFNTSLVATFTQFFNNCTSLINTTAGLFNIESATVMSLMFGTVTLPTAQYSELLVNYEAQDVQNNVSFSGGNSKYSAGAAATARADLIADHTWSITDGGAA